MNSTSKFSLFVCLALGGCMDAEPGLETEDPDVNATEQAVLQSHHDTRSFGGNIFSMPFQTYVTEEGLPSGDCSPGTKRGDPHVTWTSASGGHCEFAGWQTPGNHDCRIKVSGGTGGGGFGGTCDSTVDEIPELGAGVLFSYSAANTSSAVKNTFNYSIPLSTGQRLTFGTCDVAGALFSGDTYLRLYDASGELVASNDDACNGLGSQASYTATSSGYFQIHAGCWSSGSCSGTVASSLQ